MKRKTPKVPIIISPQAAVQIFLKIASLSLREDLKMDLFTTVADIIAGRIDISKGVFYFHEEKAIRDALALAIKRSAIARAAGARRRKSISTAFSAKVASEKTYSATPEPIHRQISDLKRIIHPNYSGSQKDRSTIPRYSM
ncbi:MAG: hypothetical protein K2K55_03500 [Duncaniella sp.]|nr:hypothetical protein [Duncaniella sp.]